MSGRIPEDIIEKIRDEVLIEDVVGHFVPLQRKGSSFWAPCPFHTEKTPSFHVHPQRQIFYCFGCHRGGNVFRFLMDKEGMSFPEAVQWCASRIGLDLARYLEEPQERSDARAPILEANRWFSEWIVQCLRAADGATAREYCRQRGLQPETVEGFGLGLSPADGQALVRAAEQAGFRLESLLQASLLRRREGAGPFAYFRSRLIFPVRGVAEKIYGFGGRILGPGEPKYLNSPETPVFQKRKTLYALPEARSTMVRSRAAVLVEGYLDALSLHQAGWTNTVATCGTAFTPEQAQHLRRYADRLVLLFDADAAGRKAAFKSADVALEAGLDVRIAALPAGKDPADLVAADDSQTLERSIQEAPGLVQSLAQEVRARGGGRTLKERALHHVRSVLPRIPDPIRAELISQEAAEVFSVPVELLRAEQSRKRSTTPSGSELSSAEGQGAEFERALLRHALAGRAARHRLVAVLRPEDFEHEAHRAVFEALAEVDDQVEQVRERDLQGIPEQHQAAAARLLMEMPEASYDSLSELEAILRHIDELEARERARMQRERLDEAWRSGQDWKSELERRWQGMNSPPRPTDPS
jgi:DNA primase